MPRWMIEVGLLLVFSITLATSSGKRLSHEYAFGGLNNQGAAGDLGQSQQPSMNGAIFPPEIESGNKGTGILNLDSPEGGWEDSAGSMENALMNYLYRKHMIQKMKQQIATDNLRQQQRKRSQGQYWKMCAFNAVSCFG